ncbi:hypothetical protein [Nocardia suismassiliense]|uniref:hypothetical protein n=1 Tax=Nocardia suismassiliense TaxID=2077092 RepID=UPI000D1F6275|nr:hypothetical protein [Nocardia suismassiliense]
MTENNGDRHRTRRRAVRSVGPPAEETASAGVTSVPVERAGTAAATAVARGKQASGAAATAAADPAVVDADPAAVVAAAPADSEPVDLDKAPADAQGDAKPKKSNRRLTTLAAAAALVLALVIAAALSTVVQAHSLDTRDARRAEYVQTARQAVLNLTTIRADSAKEDIDRILSLASGQFKNEFDGRVDPFMNIVQQAKVVSNGEIVEAAIESDEEDSAKILVAAKQTLTNAGQEGPQTRFYRFRVTVSDGNSGLTVSKVEFVA